MRTATWVLAGLLVVGLSGCDLDSLTKDEPAATTTSADVPLTFEYAGVNGAGQIDQTLDITNTSATAKAPVLVITPLDADGAEVAGVTVQTAFGSDRGEVVAPASTVVIDVLRFKGKDADEVTDVRVDVTDEGVLTDDVPPANDLVVDRFNRKGKPSDGVAASVSVTNTYDVAITVRVVGIEYAFAAEGASQQFRRLTPLAGPVTIEAGDTFSLDLEKPLSRRFFGSIKAFLSHG